MAYFFLNVPLGRLNPWSSAELLKSVKEKDSIKSIAVYAKKTGASEQDAQMRLDAVAKACKVENLERSICKVSIMLQHVAKC